MSTPNPHPWTQDIGTLLKEYSFGHFSGIRTAEAFISYKSRNLAM
jgi:hypothetical protein